MKISLDNGFTAIGDLETEGAMYAQPADACRHALSRAYRHVQPTRCSWDLPEMPTGAQFVDGADEIQKAVREQIKYGGPSGSSFTTMAARGSGDDGIQSRRNFNDEEAKAICDEAHRLGTS